MVSQNIDFGIAPATLVNPATRSHPLTEARSICVFPHGHRLEGKNNVKPRDLQDESFVSYLPDSQFRFEVDQIFTRAKVKRRLQYEARTTDAIARLVAQGLGVSIIVSMDGLAGVAKDYSSASFSPEIPFNGALIWSQQRTMSAVARDFLKMVETEFSSLQAPA
jgi:DNA-binding transcriptional LysR family regulator